MRDTSGKHHYAFTSVASDYERSEEMPPSDDTCERCGKHSMSGLCDRCYEQTEKEYCAKCGACVPTDEDLRAVAGCEHTK